MRPGLGDLRERDDERQSLDVVFGRSFQ